MAGQPPENIDLTLRRTFEELLPLDDAVMTECVKQWHSMPAWPDVARAVERVMDLGYEVFVFANGTTRLQLDLCRSSGLRFDMLFSSEMLGVYKPAEESYRRVLGLLNLRAEETVQVAAHVRDTNGARAVGMRTVYIKRWTDDIFEEEDEVRKQVDFYLEDMTSLADVVQEMDRNG